MILKRFLLIISICLALAGLFIWLLTPALEFREGAGHYGLIFATIKGAATIFGGNILREYGFVSAKALNLSPILLISFILLLAGIVLVVTRLFVKKNLIIMIITAACFVIPGYLCFFTKQLIVPTGSKEAASFNLSMINQVLVFLCLIGAAVTSAFNDYFCIMFIEKGYKMELRKGLLIISICLALIGLSIWLFTPALLYRDSAHGIVRGTADGLVTIFGGNIYLKGNFIPLKMFKLSPILLISFILLSAGIILTAVRIFVKKNLMLMIATIVCFAIPGILCFFTKQLVVPAYSEGLDSLYISIVGQIFIFICLVGAAVTSAIKEK